VASLIKKGEGLPLKTELKVRGRVFTFGVPMVLVNSGLLHEGRRYTLIIVEESDD
jgi:hypothetical protein